VTLDDDPVVGPVAAPDLHCMTFNVRRPMPHLRAGHPDTWARRAPAVAALVRSEAPHLLAVQEAVPAQVQHLTAAMGSRWTAVVADRDGGDGRSTRSTAVSTGGEHVGVVVDTDRLRVGATTTVALGPDRSRVGSRAWGAPFPRIAVLVELEDRVTGVRFVALATHVDPFSPLAQVRSARLVGALVREAGLPAVVLADWNAGERSPAARILAAEGLDDTWDLVPGRDRPASIGTYAHYREPRLGGPRLDRVLVTRDHPAARAVVERVAVSTRRPGGVWPSDHTPVHAVIRWETP
jgi:endonuclease/exonuclease/phosphatase family metal-dependent hydrolase